MSTTTLGTHQGTYDAVFQHPISRNLQWRDVKAMLSSVADAVEEEHNGNFKFKKNGQTLVVHPPRRKDFSDVEELMAIRHFLERSSAPVPSEPAIGLHLLVVIDHREARIFRTELKGTVPETIHPHGDPEAQRHLHHVDDDANGQRKPEPKSFYDAVAKALTGAEKILVFGSATGASSAMEHLLADLKKHHPALSSRVIGSHVVDEQHMTDPQLLAEARAFYAKTPTAV